MGERNPGAENGGEEEEEEVRETPKASIVTRQFQGIPPVRGALHHGVLDCDWLGSREMPRMVDNAVNSLAPVVSLALSQPAAPTRQTAGLTPNLAQSPRVLEDRGVSEAQKRRGSKHRRPLAERAVSSVTESRIPCISDPHLAAWIKPGSVLIDSDSGRGRATACDKLMDDVTLMHHCVISASASPPAPPFNHSHSPPQGRMQDKSRPPTSLIAPPALEVFGPDTPTPTDDNTYDWAKMDACVPPSYSVDNSTYTILRLQLGAVAQCHNSRVLFPKHSKPSLSYRFHFSPWIL
ncbi:unnamed protein product [Pleuronectes platessa]|uniref:Uncharacterized protein n=1 Tax=Pleuronectes platessa TaxID=8262 RepID=A0A9N7V6W1_PLEPL|nr:unnamed protein product [Pleuronectes platessa]